MPPPFLSVDSDEKIPSHVDAVIIGGGIAGVTAAWELARRGISLALIEKGVIGGEQSSRNWGWCRQQNRDEREIPLSILSQTIWDTLAQKTGADLGFRRSGLVYATNSPKDIANWEEWARVARNYGVETHVLTSPQTAALLPGNSRTWLGGVHSPTDGRAEPALANAGIACAAQAAGATIHQHCAARELDISAGRISGVVTERGLIRCSSVLIAGGAWSGMLLRHHGVKFLQAAIQSTSFYTNKLPTVTNGGISMQDVTLRRRIDGGYTVGLSGQGMLHLTPWGIRQMRSFWPTFVKRRHGLSYSLNKSFLQGPEAIRRWSADSPSPFEEIRILDPVPEKRLVEKGGRLLKEIYPALRDIIPVQAWGGIIDMTPDAIPVISPVKAIPGLFISSGFSGHGFGTGPGAGRLAADLIKGDKPSVDPSAFSHDRMIDGTNLGAAGMM